MKHFFTLMIFVSLFAFALKAEAQNGSITGTFSPSSAAVNFDNSYTDWIVWQSDKATIRKKDAGSLISNFTVFGDQTAKNFSDAARKITWKNGDPIDAGNAIATGIYVYGENNGFEFTAPASTKESTLTLYFCGWAVVGKLTASLSDASAVDYVNVTPEYPDDASFNYVIKYKAASDHQTISIKLKVSKNLDLAWGGTGNVAMQGATFYTNNATAVPKSLSNSIKVYPNPVSSGNELFVSFKGPDMKVAIYNSLGQKLMEKIATGNIAKFNVSSLMKGIYFVRFNDGSCQKFIRQ